jgi:hypothetical protein
VSTSSGSSSLEVKTFIFEFATAAADRDNPDLADGATSSASPSSEAEDSWSASVDFSGFVKLFFFAGCALSPLGTFALDFRFEGGFSAP